MSETKLLATLTGPVEHSPRIVLTAPDAEAVVVFRPVEVGSQEGVGPFAPTALSAAAAPEALTQFQVSFCATSVTVANDLQLGTIFGTSGNASDLAILYDAVATTNFYAEAEKDGQTLYGVRHGVGARLALRASEMHQSANLSYAAVAASASFNGNRVQYEVQGLGIPPSLVKDMLGSIPIKGDLTEDRYAAIFRFLQVTLPDYIKDTTKPLTLSEYIVVPRARARPRLLDWARSTAFAMREIGRGHGLATALKRASAVEGRTIDPLLVSYTYARHASLEDAASDKLPSEEAKSAAKRWLDVDVD